jgi:2-polyprenyl-3-methyl-5-hydroxy-6-metoxy-1,4-benzoquinol methylase
MNPLSPITEIMRRHDVRCSVDEFHAAVNVTFHQFESQVYDELHKDMWDSLPQQFALLAEDCLRAYPAAPSKINVLDIGCGTGLASDSLLKSPLGPRIGEVHLLDTSSAMLRRASQRATKWGVPSTCLKGTAESLAERNRYNLIVACSVLHHIPGLDMFLRAVRTLQADGGIFMHLQDPNGDFLNDLELKKRTLEATKGQLPEWASRFTPRRVLDRVARQLAGEQSEDYLSKTNRELQRSGVVSNPLTIAEIFAITDIHVEDGQGVSIGRMKQWLPDYELLSQRSYGYFGVLASTLPQPLQAAERELAARGAPNGQHIGAAWRLAGK